MAEAEDTVTNKRKASPEPSEDSTVVKRTRVEDGDETVPSNNGNDRGLSEPRNGAPPTKEERDGPYAERSPPRAQEPDSRRSPEARRLSATSGGFPGRKSVSHEEKKRGQRLFGGLLSALSRPASGSQQQRRLEIERRQQEKAQQRRAEDDKRRAEKLERVKRVRQIEQIKLEEQAVGCRARFSLPSAYS